MIDVFLFPLAVLFVIGLFLWCLSYVVWPWTDLRDLGTDPPPEEPDLAD